MKTRHLVSISTMFILAAAMLLPASARADDLKIAICNPVQIATTIKEYKDYQEKAKADKAQYDNILHEKQEKLKAMNDDLHLSMPDSPQYSEKNEAILKASVEFDVWEKMTQLDLMRKQKDTIRKLFDKVQQATADVAKAKGIELVIADRHAEIPEDLQNVTIDQLEAMIIQRSVLYADPKLDITQDVIVAMDKVYNDKH